MAGQQVQVDMRFHLPRPTKKSLLQFESIGSEKPLIPKYNSLSGYAHADAFWSD